MNGARVWIAALVSLGLAGCYESAGYGEVPSPAGDAGAPPIADDGGTPTEPIPEPGPTVDAPAISGGTLLATRDGSRLVLGDADGDRIWIVDIASAVAHAPIALDEGDEPGRMVEDGEGRVHVLLRRGGAIVALDPVSRAVLDRRAVCPAPRGVDWEPSTDLLHVACAGGQLVSLPAAGGEAVRTLQLEPDLRDVLVTDGRLYVSRFRAAELLTLDSSGAVTERRRPQATHAMGRAGEVVMTPNVAWRIRAMPGGGVVMLHQRAMSTTVDVESTGYSGSGVCRSGVVEPGISVFPPSGPAAPSGAIQMATLLVDFMVSPDGSQLSAVSARSAASEGRLLPGSVWNIATSTLTDPCVAATVIGANAQAVGVARMPDGLRAVAHRNPLGLEIERASGELARVAVGSGRLVGSRGHELFHAATPSMVACASCHPEGAEDGHVWDFGGTGPRRTQTLLGGILGTEPFHWNGDQPAMHDIMTVTFTDRMQGSFDADDVAAIGAWLDAQPSTPGLVTDAEAVARGRALFESEAVACASCHAGEALTNNLNADVGTGRAFQVPSLAGVMHRGPFFHSGCAPTLEDVVDGACGTLEQHGHTAALSAEQRADVVAYLRSL